MAANPSTPEELSSLGFSNSCLEAGRLINLGDRGAVDLKSATLEVSWLAQAHTEYVNLESMIPALTDLNHGRALGVLISDSCHVSQLNLSNNELGLEVVREMQEALTNNTTITHLNLSQNTGLGPEGGRVIASILEKNTFLKKLVFF